MANDWNDTLTTREAQCIRLVLELHTNDAIARELDLSTNTVRNHVKAARDKLGGLGRYDAARRYLQLTSEASGLSRTSTRRTMVPNRDGEPDGEAVGSLDGPEGEASFRDVRAIFAHDAAGYLPRRPPEGDTDGTGGSTLLRLLAVPTGAALIALLIVATPPMAESFKRLAQVVVPLFR